MVLQRKTVAIWAQIRHRGTSLFSGWRDNTPQEICTLQHNSLFNLPASSLATFSQASHILSNVALNQEDARTFLPISNAKYQYPITLGVQAVSALLVFMFQVFLAKDSRCHWPCISTSFKNFLLSLFQATSTPTFLVYTGLFPAFSIDCHDAPSFPHRPSTANS